MSRNSKKFQKQLKQAEQDLQAKEKPSPENLFGLSFVTPTEMVNLPTEGKFYPIENPLCNVAQVEIKHMTAKEEDMLSGAGATVPDKLFDQLIDSLLIDKTIKAEMFCEEDKTAILIQARITGYGREYSVMDFCVNCSKMVKINFDLKKQKIIKNEKSHIDYDPEKNQFYVTLPKSEIPLTLKNFSDADRKALERERQKKKELNIDFNYTVSYLKTIITAIADNYDSNLIDKLIEVMPAADAKFLNNVFQDCRPKISTMQQVTCTECNSVSRKEVPVSWAFFRINE